MRAGSCWTSSKASRHPLEMKDAETSGSVDRKTYFGVRARLGKWVVPAKYRWNVHTLWDYMGYIYIYIYLFIIYLFIYLFIYFILLIYLFIYLLYIYIYTLYIGL